MAGRMGDQGMTTHERRPRRVEMVIERCCTQSGITRDELLEGWRKKAVSRTRAECCKQLHRMKFSNPRIGLYLNMHASAVHVAIWGKPYDRASGQGPVNVPDLSGEWAI
jgi:hypothetical protein